MARQLRAARCLVSAGTGVAVIGFGTPAFAQGGEGFEQPPGYEAPAVPEVDANAPGLKLGDGATLAEPQVLDIKFVVEDIGDGSADEGGNGEGEFDQPPQDDAEPDPESEPADGADVDGEAREERTGDQRKFVLQAGVLFEKNSADLNEESMASLEAVAAAIEEEQPEWVNIFGFTDSQGSYEHGVAISNERAENTQAALMELMGDAGEIVFNLNGYSEEYFLYDNDSAEGRERNRRVEISWPTGAR